MIPYGRQAIGDDDIAAVVEVLRSDYLTQGPAVPAFERALAGPAGAAHALAVNSATSALHIACLGLGIGPGSRVWTSPVTFVASANCALYCGAQVDFVDVDRRSYNMSVEALRAKLEGAERDGTLPDLVVPVHLAGQSCEMAAIADLAARYGFKVLEDASHAVGADYRGEPVGNCRYSDAAVFSFHPVKIITTAEGGAVLTQDADLAGRLELLRTHGITRDPARLEGEADGPWAYEQQVLGFNYRMTDMQAALGMAQARHLAAFVERRRALARAYDGAFAGALFTVPWQHPDTDSSWHLYVIHLGDRTPAEHRAAFEALRARGIGVNLHYQPVYQQPFYRRLGFSADYCPEAERYYRGAISIPLYPGMSEDDQAEVIRAVMEVAGA